MRKNVNGLKRPLAMALAAALMITAVPADVAFAAPSEQGTVETVDETTVLDRELEKETASDDVVKTTEASGEKETIPEDAGDFEEEAIPQEPEASAEEVEEVEAPAERVEETEVLTEETETPAEEVEETDSPAEELEGSETLEEETAAPEDDVTEQKEAEASINDTVETEELEVSTEEDVITENETIDAQMSATKPVGKPVLTIDKDNEQLIWTPVSGAKRYEISITDGTNNYYNGMDWNEGTKTYTPNYYWMSDSDNKDRVMIEIPSDLYAMNDKGEYVEDAKGEYIRCDVPGTEYTYRVRAVNQGETKPDGTEGDFFPGDWSAPVSYARPVALKTIKDLSLSRYDEEIGYIFNFTADITRGSVYAELSKDEKFEDVYSARLQKKDNKWYLSPENWPLERYAGSQVFMRVYHEDENGQHLQNTDGTTVYSNVIKFNVQAVEVPAAPEIKNLRIDEEDESGYVFTFDAVLDRKKDQYYEIQYSKDSSFPKEGENAYRVVRSNRINYSDLDADVSYYVRAVSYVYDYGHYENGQWVEGSSENNYIKYGVPSNAISVMRKASVTKISKLALKETTQSSFVLNYSGKIAKNEEIEVQVSSNKNFPADYDTAKYSGRITKTAKTKSWIVGNSEKIVIDYDMLDPGTYYVRARVKKSYDVPEDTMESYAFSDYTNWVKVKMQVADAELSSKDVTSTSVTLSMGADSSTGSWTGYELQKKIGKSWEKLTKSTDNVYVDSKLEKDVQYSYRARTFYYNNMTGKTSKGSWEYLSVTTWGGNLTLAAESASSTSVKLSWNKISGAQGYEVYRLAGSSYSSKTENRKMNSYDKYQLVKTLSSSKTSYTDKKLTKNEAYTYYVKAYKTVDGKKFYISSNTDSATLKFGDRIVITSNEQATTGKTTITWKKVASAKGYLVEKQDPKTGEYKKYKKITKNTTTKITLPAVTNAEEPITYRVRAYMDTKNGSTKVTEYSGAAEVTVRAYLKAPSGVKASVQKDGSVKVSWKKVKGADYYVVYRTTSSAYTYNKSTKKYTYTGGIAINVYKADSASTTGYSKLDVEDVTGTSVIDRSIKKQNVNNEEIETNSTAPKAGYTYNYYVVAVKKGQAEQYIDSGELLTSAHSKASKVTLTNTTISAPKSVAVKAAKGKVTISWKKVEDAEGYEVLRATKKNGTYEVVGTVSKGTTKKYIDKTAKAGKKYYYKVRAVKANEAGIDSSSADSSIKSIKAK